MMLPQHIKFWAQVVQLGLVCSLEILTGSLNILSHGKDLIFFFFKNTSPLWLCVDFHTSVRNLQMNERKLLEHCHMMCKCTWSHAQGNAVHSPNK